MWPHQGNCTPEEKKRYGKLIWFLKFLIFQRGVNFKTCFFIFIFFIAGSAVF